MMEEILSVKSEKVLATLYTDLAQPGVRRVGQALETVLDLSNTILFPVRLLNEKVKLTFSANIKNYEQKLTQLDQSEIISVPPEIGIPIIDKLTYYTNEELAELFVNLLVTASSEKTIGNAHPSYINVIGHLSVDEARILKYLAESGRITIPFVYLKANITGKNPEKDFIRDMNLLTGLTNEVDLLFPDKIQVYMENLCANKLLDCLQDFSDPSCKNEYHGLGAVVSTWKEQFKESIRSLEDEFDEPQVRSGFYRVTNFGQGFLETVIRD